MRKSLFLVFLVSLVVASSMDARPRASQPPSVFVGATVTVVVHQQPDGSLWYRAGSSVYTPLPAGVTLAGYIVSPSGQKTLIPESVYTFTAQDAGKGASAWFWSGFNPAGAPLPSSWTAGEIGSFELDVTGAGTNAVFSHDVRVGDPLNVVGPLKSASVSSDGMIAIAGDFTAPPVAAVDGRVSDVIGSGVYVVQPPTGFTGLRSLAVCTSTKPVKCSTKLVDIPASK